MAIVDATETGAFVGYPIKITTAAKATQGDTILFTGCAGVVPVAMMTGSNADMGMVSDAFKYNILRAAAAYATVTTTTIDYDTAVASSKITGGYYLYNATSGEIMYVVSDTAVKAATSGTLTVIRGALGTTPAAIADNEYLHVMNSVVLTSATQGKELMFYMELPRLVKANILG
jgi:hypothetical protein